MEYNEFKNISSRLIQLEQILTSKGLNLTKKQVFKIVNILDRTIEKISEI